MSEASTIFVFRQISTNTKTNIALERCLQHHVMSALCPMVRVSSQLLSRLRQVNFLTLKQKKYALHTHILPHNMLYRYFQ